MKIPDCFIETSMPRWIACALMAGNLSLSACGNLTAGGFSEVDVAVSGDADGAAPAPTASGTPAAASPSLATGDQPEGEVEVQFDLFLVSQDGSARKLNGTDEIRVRVDLEGRSELDAVRNRRVEATTYTELRIVFTEIKARVDAGLVIDGIPVIGEVRVELQGPALEVSRSIDLVLAEGDHAELLVDLNAADWLQAVNPLTNVVDPSVFAALIAVVVR